MFYKTPLNFKLYDDRHILEYMNEYILQYKWLATKFAGQTFFYNEASLSSSWKSEKFPLAKKRVGTWRRCYNTAPYTTLLGAPGSSDI